KGAVLPRTVAPDELVTANAVSGLVGMVAAFAGAVGGSAFVSRSASAGFAVAAAGYLAAGAVFLRLPGLGGGVRSERLGRRLRQARAELAARGVTILPQGDVRP